MKDVSCSLDHDRPDKINMYRLKSMKICMTITCCLVRWWCWWTWVDILWIISSSSSNSRPCWGWECSTSSSRQVSGCSSCRCSGRGYRHFLGVRSHIVWDTVQPRGFFSRSCRTELKYWWIARRRRALTWWPLCFWHVWRWCSLCALDRFWCIRRALRTGSRDFGGRHNCWSWFRSTSSSGSFWCRSCICRTTWGWGDWGKMFHRDKRRRRGRNDHGRFLKTK